MSSTSVIGLANTHEQAHFVVDRLEAAGFRDTSVSIPFSDVMVVDLLASGVSATDARRCEGWIRTGDILVTVRVEDIKAVRRVKEIFARTGVREIESFGEKAA